MLHATDGARERKKPRRTSAVKDEPRLHFTIDFLDISSEIHTVATRVSPFFLPASKISTRGGGIRTDCVVNDDR